MKMFTGDLKPDLEITLSATEAVNLDDAISVRIIGQRAGVTIFDRAPSTTEVVGNTSVVTMEWQPADTATVSRISLEVEVMWPGNKPQTFAVSSAVDVLKDFDLTP